MQKISYNTETVLEAVVVDIICISGHLEWASTINKNILPMKGPTCIRCQDAVGQARVPWQVSS